jgi:GTP-binding protein
LKIEASFIRSAASASDLPQDGFAEIGLVGRSNVGKSSLINALVRQKIARTSAAPGKTRLANIYRVTRGGRPPLYLVDLPGYGYARGDRADLEAATRAFFGREGQVGQAPPDRAVAALLLVDARHPGLDSDRAAWQWVAASVESCAVAATKIDKLARGERIRALGELESVFETSVLPVSAVTGEGLDELWTLIDRLPTNRPPRPRNSNPPPKGTVRPPRRPRRKS